MTDDESPPESPPETLPASAGPGCGALLFLVVSFLSGVGYLVWVAAVEGPRIWIVLGLILLVAACAGLAHRLMALSRRRPRR